MSENGKPNGSSNLPSLGRSAGEAWRMPQRPKRLIKPPRVLSLFSGGGGLDIGFAAAGFQVVASVEIESAFCKTLEANQEFFGPDHKTICADITKFSPGDFKLGWIDFVIGGPPCQSFSAAGRRAGGVYGINDIRGSLFWHYCRILKELQPQGFLFENVRGILSANKQSAWETIVQSFAEIGYLLEYRVLDTAEYGVPQHRERLLMVGTRKKDLFRFPHPTHGPKGCVSKKYVSASEAIDDLQDPNEKYLSYGGKYEQCLLDIPPGQNYLFLTEKMGHPQPQFAWRSRFSDFLYVAAPDKPTKTIVAQPGKWAGPFHWKKRRFTVAELKRLFTFPDSFELLGTEIIQVKQLGNSVPSQLGYTMARSVGAQYFNFEETLKLIEPSFISHHDERKGEKASATRRKVKSNKELFPTEQFDFFTTTATMSWPEKDFKCSYLYTAPRNRVAPVSNVAGLLVSVSAKLRDGLWSVEIETNNKKGWPLVLDLAFVKPVNASFHRIRVHCASIPDENISALWDAVDECVRQSSSYDNIQKLYGHFTEPYPQFKAELATKSSKSSLILEIASRACDGKFVSIYHPLNLLAPIASNLPSSLSPALAMRRLGFDIRTHETNRTIPEESFRICYPFTMPLNFTTYVRWVEKGAHRTADATSIPKKNEVTNVKAGLRA